MTENRIISRAYQFLYVILPIALTSCEMGELRPVPWSPGNGGQAPPQSAPVRPTEPIAPGSQRMLTDPENPNEQPQEFDEPILAASPEEAERRCRQIAEGANIRFVTVKLPRKVRPGDNQSYRCIFEGNSIE